MASAPPPPPPSGAVPPRPPPRPPRGGGGALKWLALGVIAGGNLPPSTAFLHLNSFSIPIPFSICNAIILLVVHDP